MVGGRGTTRGLTWHLPPSTLYLPPCSPRGSVCLPSIRMPLKSVGIIFRRRLDAPSHGSRRRLGRDDLPELRGEIRLHVVGAGEQRRVARTDHLFLRVQRSYLLNPGQRDRRIEGSECA